MVLLVITLLATVIYQNRTKKLSLEVGGGKRLHTLSTAMSALILLPWALLTYSANSSEVSISETQDEFVSRWIIISGVLRDNFTTIDLYSM